MAKTEKEHTPRSATPPADAGAAPANGAANGSTARAVEQAAQADAQARIRFDTSKLTSSYCNVCNANSTREEVVLNFGLNQSWDLNQRDVDVQLLHRVILSPQAAKRLQELLGRLMGEYETRYGAVR